MGVVLSAAHCTCHVAISAGGNCLKPRVAQPLHVFHISLFLSRLNCFDLMILLEPLPSPKSFCDVAKAAAFPSQLLLTPSTRSLHLGFGFVLFFNICMIIYFGIAGSSLLHRLFSSCGEWALICSCGAWASHRSGFPCCGAQALGHTGFSHCGTWAQ